MISHMLLLFLLMPEALSSVLRVETGHQPIAIEGRDLYMGYFTKVHFDPLTCVGGLLVHCLKPLTGAEEIDLLYSACPKGHWRVAHYINMKEEFRLKTDIMAKQLLIASREPLTIIDVQVMSCSSLSTYNVSCHEVREHPHRHTHPDTLRAHDTSHIRRKRAVSSENVLDFEPGSQIEIEADKIVPRGSTMTVNRGSVLKFADGVKLQINGALVVKGTTEAPVRFEAMNSGWKGILIDKGSPASSLRYLNISGAQGAGITIIGGIAPVIENVISDSNGVGFRIESNSSEIRVVKSLALNNRGAGFIFSGKAPIVLDSCSAAANRGNGIQVQGSSKLRIMQSSCYSNSKTGIITTDVSSFKVEDVSASGNGAGFRMTKRVQGKSIFEFFNAKISGHHYGPAILLEDDIDTELKITDCQIHDNYQGGIKSVGHFEGVLEIRNTNFTRNRGPTVSVNTFHKGSLLISESNFLHNQLNDYAPSEAVLQIVTDHTLNEVASALITNCQFKKNIMNDVILLKKDFGIDPNMSFIHNDIHGNLARNVLSFNSNGIIVKENFFNNAQSSCEILVPSLSFFNSGRNYWGYSFQAEIRERICLINSTEVVIARNVDESLEATPNLVNNPLPPFEKLYNQIKSLSTPYTIDKDITILSNQTVIVEPGTEFIFGPNVGITIQERGKFVLNGTSSEPIRMYSNGLAAWRGITVKPGGSLMMSEVSIKDPSIGVWLDSDRFYLENVVIKNPIVHGVEVTANAGEEIDLGGTIIMDSVGTALAVDERIGTITLKDFSIINAGISGIDFASPSGSIAIEDAEISNSGSHGIHISEFSQSPLYAVSIKNTTLKNQKTGYASLLISAGWINEINISQLRAEGNSVPAIMLVLECNAKPSMTKIIDSIFLNNKDTVVSLQMGECGGLQIERNLFDQNNADGRAGAIRVDSEPNPGLDQLPIEIANNDFSANGGDFVVFLSTDGEQKIQGKFNRNRLSDNAVSQAALIVASPRFSIQGNRFENPKAQYQLETRGDDSWILNATNNWWGTADLSQIMRAVKAPEGRVRLQPFLVPGDLSAEAIDGVPISSGSAIVPVNTGGFEQCTHINYCSHRGQCHNGICICPEGYIGADCSLLVGCTNNCSRNGICNAFNVCHCFEGWTGQDCSQPMCSYDCGGHGKCVSKDECECEEKWTGEFCLEPACSQEICINGKCNVTSKLCDCDGQWRGKRCDVPICSECSLNGICIAPEQCKCFEDWGGKNCSICIGSSCSACDLDCDHGNCDQDTRTCTCAKGYNGAACDICETAGGCSPTGIIFTLLPQTADKEDLNNVITVFGSELPQTPNGIYYCVFGMHRTTGIRQSSSIIRCPIPANLTAGRHLFNLAAGSRIFSTPDGKPVHFTVYDSCNPNLCQGSCFGPLCICPKGKTGVHCELVEPLPEIDQHFLNNQQANIAVEGTPYIVYLPTMKGTVLRVNSSIPDLRLDSAKGLLEWPDPIGRGTPHDITVTAHSLSGESTLSWNVSVKPSYNASIEDIFPQGNKLIFQGYAQGEQIKQMPITIKVRSADGTKLEELTTLTDNNGNFTYAYIPVEPGEYFVSAFHPGEDVPDQKEFSTVAEPPPKMKESGDHFVISIAGEKNCVAKTLPSLSGEVSTEMNGQINGTDILLRAFTHEEFFILVQCENGKELIRIPRISDNVREVIVIPSELHIFPNDSDTLSLPIEIKIKPQIGLFSAPLQIESDRQLHFISIVPSLDDFTSINEHGLTAVFQMNVTPKGNGEIYILSNKEKMQSIPYSIVLSDNPLRNEKKGIFVFTVCIRDEFYNQPQSDNKIVASLSFTNLQKNIDQTQNNVVVNGEKTSFILPEGYYQVRISSPLHEKFSEFIQISSHKTSICFNLQSAAPIVASILNGNWTETLINKPNGRLPYLELKPSVIEEGVSTDVLVTVKGDVSGVLSVENNNYFRSKVQSVIANDSFWAQANIRIENLANDLCDAYLVPINFDYLSDDAEKVVKASSNIIVKRKFFDEKLQQICDANGNIVPVGYTTKILCNCGEGAKARCRAQYRTATACGSSWSRIPDDTVSLEVLSTFLLLLSDCKDVHVDFEDLNHVLQCVSALEAECPVVNRRKKKSLDDYPIPPPLETEQMQADGPASIINQISSIQGLNIPMQPQLMNVLNAIDMQSFKVATLYQDFFSALKAVFPIKIPSREDMEAFMKVISEKSDGGMEITEKELDELHDKEMPVLWNDTVSVWTSGKMNISKGIRYDDAKKLVVASDKLKSFARQNGASDPFAVLHEYLGKLLQTPSTPNQECAQATVLIEPKPIYDGDVITIRVFLTNTKNEPLISPSLEFEVLRADSFTPEATVVASGIGINPNAATGILSPGESLETIWLKRIIPQKTLTTTVKYLPVITVSFAIGSRLTKQRLTVPTIEIRPLRSVKIIHLIYPFLHHEAPFTVATSIMNIGYSILDDVKIHSYELIAVNSNGNKVPYKLEGVKINDNPIEKSLTFGYGTIFSGDSIMIYMNISSEDSSARVGHVNCSISIEGKAVSVQETSTYFVHATAGKNGIIVTDRIGAKFFFRPDAGTLVNIVPLVYVDSRTTELEDPKRIVVIASFRNEESRAFTGSLWGRFPYPDMPDGYELVKVTEKANGKRDRSILPILWRGSDSEGEKLNFLDNGFLSTSYTMNYEFLFADPSTFSVPRFEQDFYRIPLILDVWWPKPASRIGQVAAESNDGAQIVYALYSPDNSRRFSVDDLTGNVIVEEPIEKGKEYCLVMVARDTRGQESRVPVVINTGGPRQECYLFNIEGLKPLVSHWSILPTMPPTSSGAVTISTLPTRNPPTEPTPSEIDIPTPPDFNPSDEPTEGTAATKTISTENHVSVFTTPTSQPITDSPQTERTPFTDNGHTIIVVPTFPWTSSSHELHTESTDFITPDHTLITFTTPPPTEHPTSLISSSHSTETSTESSQYTTMSTHSTSETEITPTIIYTITPDRTPTPITTGTPDITVGTAEPHTETTSGTTFEISWTETSSTDVMASTTSSTHVVTPDSTPADKTPTAAIISIGTSPTRATIEPSITFFTSHTVRGSTVITSTISTTTGESEYACKKTAIPVFNLICELSKTIVRRGG